MDDKLRGVFATRAPARPNPIGISVVRLVKIKGCKLYIEGVDIVDETPLLDIKLYVSKFDIREKVKVGWLSKKVDKAHKQKADERFKSMKTQLKNRFGNSESDLGELLKKAK